MFVYPKYFPALCVTETESDPKDIRYNGIQVYPVGMSAEQAMALVWKPNKFQIEASFKIAIEQCSIGGPCVYSTANVSGSSDDNSEHANLAKMSDLICLESYYPEYAFTGYTNSHVLCDGTPIDPIEAVPFLSIIINKSPIIENNFSIYLYNKLYYLCMLYGIVNGGSGNLEDDIYTANVGDFTIKLGGLPAVKIPLYASPINQGTCDIATASATFTMITERETR